MEFSDLMMPCDTPPPPSPLDNMNNDGNIEEFDESIELDESYDFIDAEELESMPQDDSSMTFAKHTDAVFCCNIDKTGQYVATGGQDDTAFVWSVCNGHVKFECTGHKDSVIFADFSPDSKYVATVDMMGLAQVFDINNGSLVWSFDTFDFAWAQWLHKSNILLAGSVDGSCWKWSIPDGTSYVYENRGIVSIGAVSDDDQKLAVGYSDGSMKFWDLNTDSNLGSLSGPSAFKGSVTTIQYSPDKALMIAASEDGTAKLIKMSDLKVLWTLEVCDDNDHDHEDVSVESVGFCNNPSLIAIGTNCGFLGVYDISSKTKRFSVSLNTAIVKLICDVSDPVVYLALTEGIIQAYDIRTGLAVKTWSGHRSALLDLAMSSDRSMFLSASEDYTCKMFEKGNL